MPRDGVHHPVAKLKVQPSHSIPTDILPVVSVHERNTVGLPTSGASTATTKGTLFLPAESPKEKGGRPPCDAFVCPPSYAAINPAAKLEAVQPTSGAAWPKYGFGHISQSRTDQKITGTC